MTKKLIKKVYIFVCYKLATTTMLLWLVSLACSPCRYLKILSSFVKSISF